jgi:hypothetical protein
MASFSAPQGELYRAFCCINRSQFFEGIHTGGSVIWWVCRVITYPIKNPQSVIALHLFACCKSICHCLWWDGPRNVLHHCIWSLLNCILLYHCQRAGINCPKAQQLVDIPGQAQRRGQEMHLQENVIRSPSDFGVQTRDRTKPAKKAGH